MSEQQQCPAPYVSYGWGFSGDHETAEQAAEVVETNKWVPGAVYIRLDLHEARVRALEAVLNEVYPLIAGRSIRLIDAREYQAAREWEAVVRRVHAALAAAPEPAREDGDA